MAEKRSPSARLRDAAEYMRRKHEAHLLKKQLEACSVELSTEMEKYGQACFSGSQNADSLKQGLHALQTQASALEKRIDQLTGVFRCPDCGQEMGEGDAFCRRCGRSMHKTAASAQILWPEEKENSEIE